MVRWDRYSRWAMSRFESPWAASWAIWSSWAVSWSRAARSRRRLDSPDARSSWLASLVGELASGRMAAPVVMEMTLVARFYQRLADHAVNIARRASYLAGPTAERATRTRPA